MANVSMKYQYGANVWEERFVNVSLPASDYTTIAFYTGIRYAFGIVCNVGVTLSGVTVEEYLNDGYRTSRAP